jgi:hypothetical protein
MPGTYRLTVALALALLLAACASNTPPPSGGDPTPLQPVPVTSLEGRAEAYADGPANVAVFDVDWDVPMWYLGSSVGSINAEGDFSLTLNDGLPTSVLFTTNADEVAELYGECLVLSRSWRVGGRGVEVYTGDDIQARTTVGFLRPVDGDDLATQVALSYIRPVPSDATVTLTVRLPIEATVVTEAGATEPTSTEVSCGDDVRAVELVQGWYWTVTKGAFSEVTLPNGDEVEYQIVTRFDITGDAPEGLRWLID